MTNEQPSEQASEQNDKPHLLLGGTDDGRQVSMYAGMANRHGLVAGATGTGKTVTLQVLAEQFSRLGVPVFLADIKGDLSGLARPAKINDKIQERIDKIGISDYSPQPTPVIFWDLLGKRGHPIRTTVSEMGPLLLSNLFGLNDTQTGILYTAFKIADDEGLLLVDMKDLRAMLQFMADNAAELRTEYGNITSASVGAIQRELLILEEQGGDQFFGEPAVELYDLMQRDFSGNGVVSILDVTDIVHTAPKLYATFLLWIMSELFENLPEVGDADRPKMVFFFDEAHLLFEDAPKALVNKIEQVVRLIRSKGVGIYFVTQNPLDIPEDVLGQLGLKIEHALRAFTPKDQKAVRTVADTFPPNPNFDTAEVITELGTGVALVSTLDIKGRPTPVEKTLMCPPESQIGPISDEERAEIISRSPLRGRYDEAVDPESAYELLTARIQKQMQEELEEQAREIAEKAAMKNAPRRSNRQSVGEAVVKSLARSMSSQVGRSLGRQILRGILGGVSRR